MERKIVWVLVLLVLAGMMPQARAEDLTLRIERARDGFTLSTVSGGMSKQVAVDATMASRLMSVRFSIECMVLEKDWKDCHDERPGALEGERTAAPASPCVGES